MIFHESSWADIALPPLTLGCFAHVFGDCVRAYRRRDWVTAVADWIEAQGRCFRRWTRCVAAELRR